jgi:HSP20 family molecular chaperone IbpA
MEEIKKEKDEPLGSDELIKRMEKRIEELEKKLESGEKQPSGAAKSEGAPSQSKDAEPEGPRIEAGGIVEGVIGQFIPGLGGIIKALEKSSPEFRKRIEETDSEIKHRLDIGWSSQPVVDYSFSTSHLGKGKSRSVRPGVQRRAPEVKVTGKSPQRQPIVDVLEDKEFITVIADFPGIDESSLLTALNGAKLEFKSGEFLKVVELPGSPKEIVEKSCKNGILQIKISK